MTDLKEVLRKVAPNGRAGIIEGFAASLSYCVHLADLTTTQRLAMFIAQCAHESDGFKTTTEYASGKAYEGRRDLGNLQPGDGVRFKGRGLIQLTGRANYEKVGNELGIDFLVSPERAAQFPFAAEVAAVYWKDHKLNTWADKGDFKEVTRRINGGYNGFANREVYLKRAAEALRDYAAPHAPDVPKVAEASPEAPKGLPEGSLIDRLKKALFG